ncbi:MAG: TolB family protein, partial [Deltaproteobacteria bacterium]
MVPRDVYALTTVADPRLSPDGTTVACVAGSVDEQANEYRAAIWLAAADGSAPPRPFTSGEKADADPRWSPDGTRLAFTSNRADKTSQLYVMPVAGGEPRKLTSLKEDVTQAAWSPDGTRIAFVARVRDAAYEEEDDKKRPPRRFTRLQYKLDSVGWTADRPQHLFVVPADGSAEPAQVTHGDYEDHSPCWSPDGRTLAFVSARHEDWDLGMVNDVYLVDAAGGEPRRLTQGGGSIGGLSWAPDGSRLAVDRYEGVFDDPKHSHVALVDLDGGAFTVLTRSLDLNCATYPGMREPLW